MSLNEETIKKARVWTLTENSSIPTRREPTSYWIYFFLCNNHKVLTVFHYLKLTSYEMDSRLNLEHMLNVNITD